MSGPGKLFPVDPFVEHCVQVAAGEFFGEGLEVGGGGDAPAEAFEVGAKQLVEGVGA